jgi:hypothetical protein
LFNAPQVLLVYTTRNASELVINVTRDEFLQYADQIGADYWLLPVIAPPEFRSVVRPVFKNEAFIFYRIIRGS